MKAHESLPKNQSLLEIGLLNAKKKAKRGYYKRLHWFCAILFALNLVFSVEVGKSYGNIAGTICLFCLGLGVPLFFLIFVSVLLKKEKLLKFVDWFDDFQIFILNSAAVFALYVSYYQGKPITEDLNAIIGLYSIAWAIFGISAATIGVWLSINTSLLFTDSGSTPSFSFNQKRFYLVGFIFVSLGLLANIFFLLNAISFFSNGIASTKSTYFIAIIFLSSHTLIDVLIFLLVPAIKSFASTFKNGGFCSFIEEINKTLESTKKKNNGNDKACINELPNSIPAVSSDKKATKKQKPKKA